MLSHFKFKNKLVYLKFKQSRGDVVIVLYSMYIDKQGIPWFLFHIFIALKTLLKYNLCGVVWWASQGGVLRFSG